MPICRWLDGTCVITSPPSSTSPVSGAANPATRRSSVVFPQPDGPSRVTRRLAGTAYEMSSMAVVPPNRLVTPRSSTFNGQATLPQTPRSAPTPPRSRVWQPAYGTAADEAATVTAAQWHHPLPGVQRQRDTQQLHRNNVGHRCVSLPDGAVHRDGRGCSLTNRVLAGMRHCHCDAVVLSDGLNDLDHAVGAIAGRRHYHGTRMLSFDHRQEVFQMRPLF